MAAETYKPHILLVDDVPENLVALEALLDDLDLIIIKAGSGNDALAMMLEYDFSLVLLDVQMPEMDGFEVAELMQKREKTRHLPIIFVTAFSKSENLVFKGYETGAVDYLFKPLNPIILKSKVRIFLELHLQKRELEQSKLQIEKKNERLKELSVRDGLTGLYNHRYFHELLNREFYLARRNRYDLSCFMIDLDYFKDVNDTYGHTFGDFVLRRFARLIKGGIRQTDILARYGGEEFVLLLPHTDLEGARVLAEKFRKKAEVFVYQENDHKKQVTASIGISTYETHKPRAPVDLISFADRALYRAKSEGRNRVKIFNESELAREGKLKPTSNDIQELTGLQRQLGKIHEKVKESIMAMLEGLPFQPGMPESRDRKHTYNREHTNRTSELLDMMCDRLGLPHPLHLTFKRAAKLHDLFKIYFNDETPLKDGPLTEEELGRVRDYPVMMEHLARQFDIFADERMILRYHHEHYDGNGYPEGLRGAEVPLGARLFAIVDAYVSMTSPRKYRPVLSPKEAAQELSKLSGSQFDPLLLKLLLELIDENKIVSKEDSE